ncbi:MAG: glycosyltransferase [Candidatus Eisenbacteria bacterium]|nr:glycosyltransferase [Candidatus Eisenbacteria bacterium]
MKVLHLAECPSWGGGAAQVLALLAGLSGRGHHVSLATTPGSELERRARTSGLDVIGVELRSELNPLAIARLVAHVALRRVEIVHAHASHAHSVGLITATLACLPFVVTRRVSFRPKDNLGSRLKYLSGRVGELIAVSRAVKDVLTDYGVDPSRIEVIYSGTDPRVFHPGVDGSSVRSELGLAPDAMVVGKIANFYHRWKGHDTFLEAAAILTRSRPELMFLLAGHETDAPKTHALIDGLGLDGRVATAGFRTDVPNVIAALDVSVNSPRSGEGLSGAVRESMAMGRPVVATDVGGNRELVADGETGLLVPPGDPEALARAVAAILDDPALATRLSENGARFVRENLTIERMVRATEDLYVRIMNARR